MVTPSAQPLLRLLQYGKPYQAQIWSAIANSILNTIFDLAPPYLIGIAIDVVVNEENSPASLDSWQFYRC
jgi:ATP-binding cassette, subfamily B, bacterial